MAGTAHDFDSYGQLTLAPFRGTLLPWQAGFPVCGTYPNEIYTLTPSQKLHDALREMGPQKASTALVHALARGDSKLYERYRVLYTRFPAWYQNHFPLRLTQQQRVTLILGSTEFFDLDYQKAMIPFLIAYLDKPDAPSQIAACELLANMPEAASLALPGLKRLTTSAEPSVCQAAQIAVNRIQP